MTAAKNVDMWHPGSRRERKHFRSSGDARTSANLMCSASARLVDLRAASRTSANSDNGTMTTRNANRIELAERVARFVPE